MAEGIITRRGGGAGKQPFALIQATFPSGTCTCTNGVISITATSSPAMFAIPEAGEWTVKAEDGTQGASKIVVISAAGQVESVELSYILYIVSEENGLAAGYSCKGGMTKSGKTVRLPPQETSALSGYISPAIDMSKYSTLRIDAYAGAVYVGLGTPADGDTYTSELFMDGWKRYTASINVKSLNGLYYFKARHNMWSADVQIYNLWLEP